MVKLKEEQSTIHYAAMACTLAPTSAPVDVASESVPVPSLTLPGVLSHWPC